MRSVSLSLVLLCACGADRIATVEPLPAEQPPAQPEPFTPAPPPAPRELEGPPYPVVFVHGMAGFDALKVGGLSMDYFGDTVQDLQARGEDVYRVVLPPFTITRGCPFQPSSQYRTWSGAKRSSSVRPTESQTRRLLRPQPTPPWQ